MSAHCMVSGRITDQSLPGTREAPQLQAFKSTACMYDSPFVSSSSHSSWVYVISYMTMTTLEHKVCVVSIKRYICLQNKT